MPPVLAWDGVTAVVPATKKAPAKTILSSATGVVRAGAGGGLCAVLGPSGSGKTTLLTILAGHEPPASGRLTLDGAPYDARTAARVGFVPQVDQLFSTLTVLETLVFAQEMRNGATPAKQLCHDVLAQVGLERVADQREKENRAHPRGSSVPFWQAFKRCAPRCRRRTFVADC